MFMIKQKSFAILLLCGLGVGFSLSACDIRQPPHEQFISNETLGPASETEYTAETAVEGHKLSEIAGQASLPQHSAGGTSQVTAYEQQFVGRYHTQMSCADSFVDCQQGNAEYVLNLLADGTAHRMIVQYGKIYTGSQAQRVGRYDWNATWQINRKQNELVVQPEGGNKIFYRIESRDRLVMNVEKIQAAAATPSPEVVNPPLFNPSQNYVLIKDVAEKHRP